MFKTIFKNKKLDNLNIQKTLIKKSTFINCTLQVICVPFFKIETKIKSKNVKHTTIQRCLITTEDVSHVSKMRRVPSTRRFRALECVPLNDRRTGDDRRVSASE